MDKDYRRPSSDTREDVNGDVVGVTITSINSSRGSSHERTLANYPFDPPTGKKTDRCVRSLTASELASPLARLLSHSRIR